MKFAPTLWRRVLVAMAGCLLLTGGQLPSARAEGLLQLFNVSYSEIARKMPELAEAGYGSLWLPPPTKGSGGLSVGYDLWDPFDLGQKDQRNSVRTRYGTEADLQHMMDVAHRFGIRVYFDNIMNHRAFDIPGFNENTPTGGEGQEELYPGVVPEDFHLRVTEDGFYRKWDNTRNWQDGWQVLHLGLSDLIDIAHETPNANFGRSEGSTHPKYSFVRDLNRPEQYDRDANGNVVYFGWLIDRARAALGTNASTEALREHAKAYVLTNRTAYVEDIGAYLIRAARWKIDRTKADGFRLDAVKHVPDYFFGQLSGTNKDTSDAGYLGGVQRQFNLTRGFSDPNHRDSVFNEKKGRDDAMVFGEHLGQPPGYGGYVDAGMRLVDNDLRSKLNDVLGKPGATLFGLDAPGAGGFSASVGVTHANSHDNDFAAMKEMQHAHYMFREGMGLVYSDGYYKAGTLGESGGAFPRHANTHFLGQFGDPRIPNILKIHNDFARGLQQGRFADNDFMAYERRDNRNAFGDQITGRAVDEITMVAMFNDNTAQGQARSFPTSFPAGAYLYQYAEGPNGSFMGGFYKYANELGSVIVPPGGYYVFSWRTPELSTLWPNSAITLYQTNTSSGRVEEVPRITVTRRDGPDGDKNFNPYGLPNRGYPEGVTPPDYTYRMTVPVVKSGPVTILARADGSAENIRLKLNGGIDLNGTPTSEVAKRDFPPGVYSDIWVGYEQPPEFVGRQHPEKFAAVNTTRCQIGSPGAETFVKTVGGAVSVNNGPTNANSFGTNDGNVASFLFHSPTGLVEGPNGTSGVGDPQLHERESDIVLWAKANQVADGFKMFVYYTLDGSFPEGAGGIGRGTTRTAELNWRHNQTGAAPGAWWSSATIPKPAPGTVLTYKIGIYRQGSPSWWPGSPGSVDYKKRMLTTFRVQNFDLSSVQFFPHNDYARVPTLGQPYASWPWAMQTGLSEGFHVIRARAYLPNGQGDRSLGATPLYNTFTQVFYYDALPPSGTMLWPAANGDTVGGSSYELVIHTDLTVEDVWFHIADSENGNDDATTKILNGNGAGFEPFVDANQDGIRQSSEEYTDVNGNNQYDTSLAQSWGQATNVTSTNLPDKKEWRFRYNNIPANGAATITVRLHEASSTRDIDLAAGPARVNEVVRTVQTRGPDQRVNIAWAQRDGDSVDDNYTMKVYFTKSLADGLSEQQLKDRFTFSIASTEDGTNRDAVVQSRDNFDFNYNVNDTFHELAIPLPNMYNDLPNFRHTLTVTYTFPDNRKLEAVRLVKANPSTKPFVRITRPSELGSDGRPTEIILKDGPGDDQLLYDVRVESSSLVTQMQLIGSPALDLTKESFTDTNLNGAWDDIEPLSDLNNNGQWDEGETYVDLNNNGQFDPGENFVDLNNNGQRDDAEPYVDANNNGQYDGLKVTVNGNTKTWDYTWRITQPGNYLLTATATLNGQSTSTVRNARVLLRQITDGDEIQTNDDDNDGLIDSVETNKTDLPQTQPETWSNGDVHVWRASGVTLPISPDSDGDLLPDALEVGWRVAATPPTLAGIDTNQDGIPNFIGDLDPPLYAVVAHHGFVPGVGSQNQGDDRTRQAAGSVTDPTKGDTDSDGISDGIEDRNRNGWTDGDGKSLPLNANREQYATSRPNTGDWPNNFIDSFETWTETSPTKADSDEDGLQDGFGEDKNFNGVIDGDINPRNRTYDAGEQWSETDPLKPDTDGDGLSDGWEAQYGLDPLDNGTTSMRTGGAGSANNGALGDPDNDGFTNAQELASGTNPNQQTGGSGGGGEGPITIGTFTGWDHEDLLVLDEYNEGNSNGGADVFRSFNSTDNSRDIVSFSFRDGGEEGAGGDGRVYFRIDFLDLEPNGWQGEVDAYVVIDTGNPAAGERSMPNEVDIATDMRWEAVVGVYGPNLGTIFVDRNVALNTTTEFQNPVTAGGVDPRGFGGPNEVAWSSTYDAVEIAVERRHLRDAGWLGDPNTLNFQVFTTKPLTQNDATGTGDLSGRNDIRDTIYDDWLASDWWRDQDRIRLQGKLTGYFSRTGSNDRNRNAKVMLLAHGNQAIQPASVTQSLILSPNGTNAPVGYHRLIKSHQDHNVPLTLHVTPTLASSLQWASNPNPGSWPNNDGPSLNQRIRNLVTDNKIDLIGSTFADHVPKYFQNDFNIANKQLADEFLSSIYGSVSSNIFWPTERVLDDESLVTIRNMGYTHVFADQMRHLLKWFGRSSALGTAGYRINRVNDVNIIPIHDVASEYLEQTMDQGSPMAVRQLLSRRSRSDVQDQVVVLWTDIGEFASPTKVASYDTNVRWLGSRPWIRVVTAQQIADNQVSYVVDRNGNTTNTWGTETRGTGRDLRQTAKDWVDWATRESYDNWYNKLSNTNFGANTNFGRVGLNGHANAAWNAVTNVTTPDLNRLARAVIGGAMFQTAFHFPSATTDLRKFSTGDYINPANNTETMADFARNTQAQTRFAKIYERVQQWHSTANSTTHMAVEEDVDLDGQPEYLLYNSRVFAVIEKKGGRMTAAWMRHPTNGKIWQVAGNFASYANTDTEDEGASNATAYRTSGFKDWWRITSGTGSSAGVNTDYIVSAAPGSAKGWTFSSGGVSKTITLPNASQGRIAATYSLSGPSSLYVRFGLSPNLLDLMLRGNTALTPETIESNTRASVANSSGGDVVRAWVEGPRIVGSAVDRDGTNLTTLQRRNQAQTHQVEVELTGAGPHTVTLGFDNGADEPTSTDGIPDTWWSQNNIPVNERVASADRDGDGLTNMQEYVLGSNPNNASSGFPPLTVESSGDTFRVSFPTVAGRRYTVLGRSNLTTGSWSQVTNIQGGQSNPVTGDGNIKTVTETGLGATGARFYRIQVELSGN